MPDIRDLVMRVLMNSVSESSEGPIITIRVDEDQETYLTIESEELVFKTPNVRDIGKCNASLIGFLSRVLRVPSSRIEIVYGARGFIKRVLVRDISYEDLVQRLQRSIRIA